MGPGGRCQAMEDEAPTMEGSLQPFWVLWIIHDLKENVPKGGREKSWR